MLLNEAVELGGDEGMELAKVLVLRSGEAGNCWNDQPWFFSQILRLVLACFGDNIVVPRVMVALFAMGLLCAVTKTVFGRVRLITLLPVACFWLLSPHILDLNVSAMLEIPSFAVMTLAIAMTRMSCESGKWGHFVASGVLAGAACQLKLITAMYAPALILWVVLGSLFPEVVGTKQVAVDSGADRYMRAVRNLALVGAAAGLAFGTIMALAPSWRWDLLWDNHAKASSSYEVLANRNYEFTWRYLWYHEESLIGGFLGIICLVWRRQWLPFAALVAMYGAAILIHLNHKPYWYFYYVHIAIPASALSAYGLVTCIEVILTLAGGERDWRWVAVTTGSVAGASLLIGSAVVFGVPRFRNQWQELNMAEKGQESPVLAAIRANSRGRATMFSRRPIFYFHSRLTPIPDLALLVKKRFWSGDLSEQSVVTKVIAGKPDLLHLDRRHYPPTSPINAFLQDGYTLVWNQGADEVWIRTRSLPANR